jgi:hypothetical protein
MPSPFRDLLDRNLDRHIYRFKPTPTSPAKSVADYREICLTTLGMAPETYARFLEVAGLYNCVILVRKTNQGVIYGFTTGQNVTGKTLATKLKSSEFHPIQSNLGFFKFLSKADVTQQLAKGPSYWNDFSKGQGELVSVVNGPDATFQEITLERSGQPLTIPIPDQGFIPKVLPWTRVKEHSKVADTTPPDWIVQIVSPDAQKNYPSVAWSNTSGQALDLPEQAPAMAFLYVKVQADSGGTAFQRINQDFGYDQNIRLALTQAFKARKLAESSVPADPASGEFDTIVAALGRSGKLLETAAAILRQTADASFGERLNGAEAAIKSAGSELQSKSKTTPRTELKELSEKYVKAAEAYQQLAVDLMGSRGSDPKKPLALPFSLVPDQKQADQEYYRLYLKRPKGMPAIDAQQEQAFAPKLTPLPAGVPQGDWAGVSVLAQFKLAPGDQATNPKKIFFYEIVADYDLFAIAPSLADFSATVRGSSGRSQTPLTNFFPKFSPDRGLISEYERRVRTSLNQSLSQAGWLNQLYEGVAEAVLHGCEVNNYFYTEAHDELLLIVPGVHPDVDECARFRFSTGDYIQLYRQSIDMKAAAVNGQTWPEWKYGNCTLAKQWLPHLNLAWMDSLGALGSLLESELSRPSSPEMLLYYGGVYRYLFLELGKWFDQKAHHLDLSKPAAPKEGETLSQRSAAATNVEAIQKDAMKLTEFRKKLKEALDLIYECSLKQRAATISANNRQAYVEALRTADGLRVTRNDAKNALVSYAKHSGSEIWESWIRTPRHTDLPSTLQVTLAATFRSESEATAAVEKIGKLQNIEQGKEQEAEPEDRPMQRRRERYNVVLRLWQEEMNWVLEAAERHKKGFGHQALCKSLGRQEQSQPRPESAFARTAKSERTPERKANTVD